MTKQAETAPLHPGLHIKERLQPSGLSVKAAAELLGIGRPALSNLLNGNAALSPEMALRLEKAFGLSQQKLLQMQAEFDQHQQRARDQNIAVRAFVPSFLKIKARDIEQWVDGNLEARSRLPVFLRKLIHSTGTELTLVDFPGYDSAEKKGWDGRVEAGAATPWIPLGKSGWEFGCNEDPKQKADGDYSARLKAIPAHERADMHFVFVTPRNWNGKEKWIKEKRALGDWSSVRAYDAGDLEQWLEQSIPVQGWFAEQTGAPADGVHSLEEQWQVWASVTDPELSTELFAPSVEHYISTIKSWLENQPSSPLIVCGDSKLEALAFLHCVFSSEELAIAGYKDRAMVFSSPQALRKLATASPSLLPIISTEEAERESGGLYKKRHIIIVRPRNTVELKPDIVLDLLGHEDFRKALAAMGIDDHLQVDDLARESGHSPTILRRRLSKNPSIRTPAWTQDAHAVRALIPMMLVGAWHTQSKADCEILSFLAGVPYDEIEKQITELLKSDDSPVWSVGTFRGVSSKIDTFFAVQTAVTQSDLAALLFAAEVVLSEKDPALELPKDKRAFAGFYGKTREHSGALREGICETLVLLAVHGNDLFSKRLGIDLEAKINGLVRSLMTPLTVEKLLSQTGDLPLYAEAAPGEFLKIIEEDLKSSEPQVYALMKPAKTGLFGGGCSRTGLLWALETLAWKPELLPRVSLILAKLSERKIEDNWANKPENSLQAIFRSWMPQTAAPLDQREKALEVLTKKFPPVAWQICVAQFAAGNGIGEYSHRPRWRSDASGSGQPVIWGEIHEFGRWALDLALAWSEHDENTLGDLIANLQDLPDEDQPKIWDLVENWARAEMDEGRKALLRERIRRFALTRRGKHRGLKTETRDRAREAYDLLSPADVVTRDQWLFQAQWVEESIEELEDPEHDYHQRDERIRQLRIDALEEIWKDQEFGGIKALAMKSGTSGIIGWHMADGVIPASGVAGFLERCLKVEDEGLTSKMDDLVRGFLAKMDVAPRTDVSEHLLVKLPSSLLCRFLKCSLFQHETWEQVDRQAPEVREQYWHEIYPNSLMKESLDANEVVDRLLEARRPRAAFYSVHFALEEVETSRLKRLLQEVGTCDSEAPGHYQLDRHYLSSALTILQARSGVTEEEMAQLEFQFITALEHTKHRIPNLERQVGKSPALFVQALALIYRRRDGGEDPPEWQVKEENESAVGTAAYRLLENIRRIPGTVNDGRIDEAKLRAWVNEAQSLCSKYGRAEIGDQKLGQLLSAPILGNDGVWPCEAVRKVLEEIGTPDIATGLSIAVYNSRGAHWRAEGGGQERELAAKYRNWARKLAFEYPYVANLVEDIAATYDRQAEREDSESAVRKRLRH
jgi:addiction module HigA family antidote